MKPRRPKSSWYYVFDVYRAKNGWRWRLWARNGRIVAESAEAHKHQAAAVRSVERIQDMSGSTVFVKGEELL